MLLNSSKFNILITAIPGDWLLIFFSLSVLPVMWCFFLIFDEVMCLIQ